MAKNPKESYYQKRQAEEARRGDPNFNLVYGMAEKLERDQYIDKKYKEANEKYGIEFLNEGSNLGEPEQNDMSGDSSDSEHKSVEQRPAPTSNHNRPRALNMAYIKDSQTLLVQFRDETWVEYEAEIPPEMWQDLKVTDSTGRYLRHSGIDSMPWHNFNAGQLPREVQVLFE